MYSVKVVRQIDKPIDLVFAMVTDHANYSQFPGVKAAELLEEGQADKNGVGALRYIDGGKMRLKERIIKFEPPHKMAYHIESSAPFFIDLEKGEVTLQETGQGTQVIWESKGRIKLPLIGPLMDKMMENQFARAFGAILKFIDKA